MQFSEEPVLQAKPISSPIVRDTIQVSYLVSIASLTALTLTRQIGFIVPGVQMYTAAIGPGIPMKLSSKDAAHTRVASVIV